MMAATMNIEQEFQAAIVRAGIEAPSEIIADGEIHRFSANGRRGDTAGWYIVHGDGIPAGQFGCWRQGIKQTWSAKADHEMTKAERRAHHERMEAVNAKRKAAKAQAQAEAATSAALLWSQAKPATVHAYLRTKGIQPHGARTDGTHLLIAMRDADGAMRSLQSISPEGEKRFHSGGKVTGCYYSIGKPDGKLIVCEGFATGASIHECTGLAVAVAFNAGNLQAVAQALHGKYPALQIIVAADDDYRTPGNPGLTKAREAAQSVGGLVAAPDFGSSRPDGATDFNDLHQTAGGEAVKRCIEAAAKCEADEGAWPVPTPLPDALPPVAPFDAELLPETLRPWVMDIAHRMQVPADFPAVGALVAISSLIGARAVVRPKERDDWQVVPNLWGAVVGRPGVKKSPALTEVLKPLVRLQANAAEAHKQAHTEWKTESRLAELAAKKNEAEAAKHSVKDPARARALLTASEAPEEPIARRFIVNDATVEALGVLMEQNTWGLLAYRDELYGLLTQLDKDGQEGSRSFYLTGYDGNQGHTFNRIARGEVHVRRVCLAMLGGIQPGRIQEYVRGAVAGGAADDGLLQRFGLAVWPDVTAEYVHVDQWPDTPARQAAWALFERLAELQPATDDDPVVWKFSREAQDLFVSWLVPLENELRDEFTHPAVVSHLSKYRKLIPALALVFALIDTPDAGGVIAEQELMRALAWGDYLRTHANRLYSAALTPETTGAATLLAKIRGGRLTDGDGVILERFSTRDVYRKGWAGLSTPELVRKAAELLAEFDWLRRDVVPSTDAGGRPGEVYSINPAAMNGGAS